METCIVVFLQAAPMCFEHFLTMRLQRKTPTRVLVPSLFPSKDGRNVVLSSWDRTEETDLAAVRLHELNNHLKSLNVRLGHMDSDTRQ